MNKLLCNLAAGAAFALCAPLASATVLDFEDLDEGPVPALYGGIDWSATSWFAYAGEQAPFTPHSGDTRITLGWDGGADTSLLHFEAPVVFDGAWIAGFEGVNVSFNLYLDGQFVGQSAVLGASATPGWLASGYAGLVDSFSVASNDYANFVLDDLSFAAAVPEPGSVALLLAGLGLMAAARRRG